MTDDDNQSNMDRMMEIIYMIGQRAVKSGANLEEHKKALRDLKELCIFDKVDEQKYKEQRGEHTQSAFEIKENLKMALEKHLAALESIDLNYAEERLLKEIPKLQKRDRAIIKPLMEGLDSRRT